MPMNCMIQLCKITRASKLFQRNFYLPLLKPLSPRDALRRHIITGKNVLTKTEHYIPVLEEYQARVMRRRYRRRGVGKKRQRKKASTKYVMPFFDDDMEGHIKLQAILSTKPKGKGQCYTYRVYDKNCTLVLSHQMERAIRNKDIIDVIMAQRTEKIVVTLKDGSKVTLPLVKYDGNAPFYRGEGWTRKEIEETHHHGRDTMTVAKLFEAKESGVEEWELEMMRMAAKRRKRQKGEGTEDWKAMMAATAETMDWDKFEEETRQIVAEANEPVDDKPISMEVDSMEKTKNVNEKLKNAGPEILSMLPVMPEIPEIVKIIKNQEEIIEIAKVSGVTVSLPSNDQYRFVPGQIVKSEEGDLFVPGQTILNEEGESEYTPGFTVLLDNEPTLIPGLVMGDEPEKPMFLPGESTITESGELQFTATEDDVISGQPPVEKPPIKKPPPEPEEPREVEEVELEEEQNSEEEKEEEHPPSPPPPPAPIRKIQRKEFKYERPKRQYQESMGPKHRERKPKAKPKSTEKKPLRADLIIDWDAEPKKPTGPVFYDLSVPLLEKDLLLQRKERVAVFNRRKATEETEINRIRREIKLKIKRLMESRLSRPEYVPLEPVKKSEKLREIEHSIKRGTFFDVDYKKYLNKEYPFRFNWLERPQYGSVFDTVGIMRHRVWKSVI